MTTCTPQYAALREQVASVRATAGLSQRDLAKRLGVPHSWVAKVESGERRVDLIEFELFCAACGASPVPAATSLLEGFAVQASRPTSGAITPTGTDSTK